MATHRQVTHPVLTLGAHRFRRGTTELLSPGLLELGGLGRSDDSCDSWLSDIFYWSGEGNSVFRRVVSQVASRGRGQMMLADCWTCHTITVASPANQGWVVAQPYTEWQMSTNTERSIWDGVVAEVVE